MLTAPYDNDVEVFSSYEVCRLTGATYRMLDYWERTDLVNAAQRDRGTGYPRRWSPDEILIVLLIVRMRSVQFELPIVRATIDAYRADPTVDELRVVTDDAAFEVSIDLRAVRDELAKALAC